MSPVLQPLGPRARVSYARRGARGTRSGDRPEAGTGAEAGAGSIEPSLAGFRSKS